MYVDYVLPTELKTSSGKRKEKYRITPRKMKENFVIKDMRNFYKEIKRTVKDADDQMVKTFRENNE